MQVISSLKFLWNRIDIDVNYYGMPIINSNNSLSYMSMTYSEVQ